jgi:hypothetical protein
VHLLGQLAGRHQDQATRSAAALLHVRTEAGEQRQAEGQRLARAGGGLAEHVAPGEGVRQRGGLDGERVADALALQRGDQRLGQAQLGEGRAGGLSRGLDGLLGHGSRDLEVVRDCGVLDVDRVERGQAVSPIQIGARPVVVLAVGCPAATLVIAAVCDDA